MHIRSRSVWKSRSIYSFWNDWLKSYHAEELFDENGRLIPELAELAPKGNAVWGQTRMQTEVCS